MQVMSANRSPGRGGGISLNMPEDALRERGEEACGEERWPEE